MLNAAARKPWGLLEIAAYCVIWPVLLWVNLEDPGMNWFNHHMSRDLARALDWLAGKPTFYGPEIASDIGQGLPGPSYYFYLAAFWLPSGSLPAMLALKHLSTLVIMAWAWLEFRRTLGRAAALIVLLLLGVAPFFVMIGRGAWNPSLIVPCNLLMIVLTYRYCEDNTRRWALYALFLVAAVGVQGHYSVLMGFLACLAVIALNARPRSRLVLPTLLFAAYHVVVTWLGRSGGPTPVSFAEDITQRGFSFDTLLALLLRIDQHLHLSAVAEGGYFTFTFLFRVGEALDQLTTSWIYAFTSYHWIYSGMFAISLGALLAALVANRGRFRQLHLFEQLALIWFAIVCVYLGAYTQKDAAIPYRYVLTLYPIQFLIIALGYRRIRAWLESTSLAHSPMLSSRLGALLGAVVIALAFASFAGNAFFMDWAYRLMRHSGRTYYGSSESYEIPLAYKMDLLALGKELSADDYDIFHFLHGSVAARVRLYEYRSRFLERYAGLERAMASQAPSRASDRANGGASGRAGHYFVRSLDWAELRRHYSEGQTGFPFELVPIPDSALPRNLQFSYLDEHGDLVTKRSFDPRVEMIVPFGDLDESERERVRAVKLEFEIDARQRNTLRVYYDGPKPARSLDMLEARVDGIPVSPKFIVGGWLSQTIALIKLPNEDAVRVEFDFECPPTPRNARRLDIFVTSDDKHRAPFRSTRSSQRR